MEKKQTPVSLIYSEVAKIRNSGGASPQQVEMLLFFIDELLSVEKSNIVEARVTAPLLHALDDKSYRDEAEDYYNQTFSSLT